MANQPTEQERIDAGLRVKNFVEDPIIQQVIARLASLNYSEFKKAKSESEIRSAHARGVVLDDFVNELQSVIDDGLAASIQRKERELREERKRADEAASRR